MRQIMEWIEFIDMKNKEQKKEAAKMSGGGSKRPMLTDPALIEKLFEARYGK